MVENNTAYICVKCANSNGKTPVIFSGSGLGTLEKAYTFLTV